MGTQTKLLIAEIELYLGIVDFFRVEGCEPSWRDEAVRYAADGEAGARSRTRRGSAKPRKRP